jgi:hypothetical protein
MKDKVEKLNALSLAAAKHKLIYEWVKTGTITFSEYLQLIELVTKTNK